AEMRHPGRHILTPRNAEANGNFAGEKRVVRGTRQATALALNRPIVDGNVRCLHRGGEREALADEQPLDIFADLEPAALRRGLERFFDTAARKRLLSDAAEVAKSVSQRGYDRDIRRANADSRNIAARQSPRRPAHLHGDGAFARIATQRWLAA